MLTITIDGETIEVTEVYTGARLPLLTFDDGDYYVAESSKEAGAAAREFYADMAENSPREFTCHVGEETLIQWGLGKWAGPGLYKVKSLEDWLDLFLDRPEDVFAGYNGTECNVTDCSPELEEELGFKPTVAYRNN